MVMNLELAEVCGIHAGDGYLRMRERNKGEVDISGSLEEKGYYDNHVVPLFNKVFNLGIKGRSFSRGTYGIVTYKKEVRDILMSLGFPSGRKSKTVKVPDLILNSGDKKIYGAFLRGLFDTDGNISFRKSHRGINLFKISKNHYPVITLTTTSRPLAEGVIKILHDLNIIFYYHMYDPKKLNEGRKYFLVISGIKGLDKWMNLVGMKNKVKLSRYLVWKKFGFCPTHTTLNQREALLKDKIDINSLGL